MASAVGRRAGVEAATRDLDAVDVGGEAVGVADAQRERLERRRARRRRRSASARSARRRTRQARRRSRRVRRRAFAVATAAVAASAVAASAVAAAASAAAASAVAAPTVAAPTVAAPVERVRLAARPRRAPLSRRSTSVGREFQSRSSSSGRCQPGGAAPQCIRAGAPSATKRCSALRASLGDAVAAHSAQPTASEPPHP